MKSPSKPLTLLLAAFSLGASSFLATAAGPQKGKDPYYTGEEVYQLRPKSSAHKEMGHIGPTGILAHVEVGAKAVIEGAAKGSPAEGKVKKGEIIVGVNGKSLAGLNPYVALGKAITKAEAADGKLVFDLEGTSGKRQSTITIPVLGAWGSDWPMNCKKTDKVVEQAAAFYSKRVSESKGMGIPTALPCLFLLSTGDDAHLPVVRQHIQRFTTSQPPSVSTPGTMAITGSFLPNTTCAQETRRCSPCSRRFATTPNGAKISTAPGNIGVRTSTHLMWQVA